MHLQSFFHRARLFSVLAAALAISACAGTGQDANGLGGGMNAATPGSTQDFTVNVGDRVLFQEDQSTLTSEAQAILEKQAMWLRQYPQYVFTIEGHADERGTREYNIALGARRAATVRDFLVARGIPAPRMKTISYGKERPVAVCDAETCWNQNRRAVTALGGPGT
jgi:peptidoglycan-associated lipoprotein